MTATRPASVTPFEAARTITEDAVNHLYATLDAHATNWSTRTEIERHLIRIFANGPIAAWDNSTRKDTP